MQGHWYQRSRAVVSDAFRRVFWQESGAAVRVDTLALLLACVDTAGGVFGTCGRVGVGAGGGGGSGKGGRGGGRTRRWTEAITGICQH